jgi:GTP pyrophosphokinase
LEGLTKAVRLLSQKGASKQAVKALSGTAFPFKNIPLQKIIACEDEIEEATLFLVRVLNSPFRLSAKKKKKPVVLHSLRVGFWLMTRGYPASVIIAGLLHDVLEQTNIKPEELAREFGSDVAAMVSACTLSKSLDDSLDRYRDSARRCALYGSGALQVRAADLVDNCERQLALGNLDRLHRIHAKFEILLEACEGRLKDEFLLAELTLRESQLKALIY